MPRQPRLDAAGALHHVMGRGIDGVKIFSNRKEHEDFLERLADLCKADAPSVYAWALMGNHFHMLLRTGNQALSDSMRKLLTGYVVNYNRRHKRYGHLFQKGAVRLIQYVVYYAAMDTSCGTLDVELSNRSIGSFVLMSTFSLCRSFSIQRLYPHSKN